MQTEGKKPSQRNLLPTHASSIQARDHPSDQTGEVPSQVATGGILRTVERNQILCDKWGLPEHNRNGGEVLKCCSRPGWTAKSRPLVLRRIITSSQRRRMPSTSPGRSQVRARLPLLCHTTRNSEFPPGMLSLLQDRGGTRESPRINGTG